jgi:hypothetical protein
MTSLVDDLDRVVEDAVAALRSVADRDWSGFAAGLTWSCRETVEHVSDDLFAYAAQISVREPAATARIPFATSAEPDGDEQTIHTEPESGNAGVLAVLDSCGGLLSAVVRAKGPDTRGFHPYGVADPGGFAAMGTVEVLLHLHDIAGALGFAWHPDPDVVRRVLERLFPDQPTDGDPWATLLAATGRAGGTSDDWRWDSSVRD